MSGLFAPSIIIWNRVQVMSHLMREFIYLTLPNRNIKITAKGGLSQFTFPSMVPFSLIFLVKDLVSNPETMQIFFYKILSILHQFHVIFQKGKHNNLLSLFISIRYIKISPDTDTTLPYSPGMLNSLSHLDSDLTALQ